MLVLLVPGVHMGAGQADLTVRSGQLPLVGVGS